MVLGPFIKFDKSCTGPPTDKVQGKAKNVVTSLKDTGIDITMITGDQRRAAVAIGSQLGLDDHDIRSEMLPEDKLAEIRTKV